MTFRNGIKEYVASALLFGVPMGIVFGLMFWDAVLGVITGVLSGCLFALLIAMFVKSQEKNYDTMRADIAKKRNVFCDGGATIQGNGGWLFFTDFGLEFYPHRFNTSPQNVIIPAKNIKSVNTRKNKLTIVTTENQSIAIVVAHNKEWSELITSCVLISD